MTALVQRMMDDLRRPLSIVPTEMQKTYNYMVEEVKLKVQEDLVDGWKKTGNHFQVDSVCLAASAEDELFSRSTDVHSFSRE